LRNAQRFLYSFWREFFPLSLFSQNPKLEKKKNTRAHFRSVPFSISRSARLRARACKKEQREQKKKRS
jgi:hypothetical protein